jgi:thiol-disulfide isomerase/thioredoxin
LRAIASACLVAAALALAACGDSGGPATVGLTVPDFELPARDGSTLSARSLAGAPAVIAFWATWCQPCLRDLPELNELADEDGIRVVAIALDERGWSAIDPFLVDHAMSAEIVLGDEEVFRRFGGFAIPYTVVVDSERVVRAIFRGAMSRREVLGSLGL